MFTRNDIEDMVKEGLVKDIFKMEQSYWLLKTIGLKTEEFSSGKLKIYNEVFGVIQYALQTETILAAARIYDVPSKKYPTRCLRGILRFLSDNSNELPNIREPYQLSLHLKYMNTPAELNDVTSTDSEKFAPNFSTYIESILSEPERLDAIEKLKLFRDKVIAHNEKVDSGIFGPTWASLMDLIDISKNVVGVLGWAFFNTAYVIEGEYILTKDAYRVGNGLNKLIKNLINNKLQLTSKS
jgi:hypothetical protein